MKNIKTLVLLFILIGLFIPHLALTQTDAAEDYLVLHDRDTIYGTVNYINRKGFNYSFYKKLRIIDAKGKTKKYSQKKVRSFKAENIAYEGFWLSHSSEKLILLNPKYNITPQKGNHHFLKVVEKGILSHYQLEWFEQGESLLMQADLLKRENDMYFMRATQGLFGIKRKTLTSYFNDCPKLQQQISQKQMQNLEEIVNYYNETCAKQF
ncbi:hypothetical protein [Paucihalobacter sp.]|uniref:hypothetical protein n=1 Tax=Paucihalobacter sp. TaxID=2850405 RepID=UPI002FE0A012